MKIIGRLFASILLILFFVVMLSSCESMSGGSFGLSGTTQDGVDWKVSFGLPNSGKEVVQVKP